MDEQQESSRPLIERDDLITIGGIVGAAVVIGTAAGIGLGLFMRISRVIGGV